VSRHETFGCRGFFYIEYVPVSENEKSFALSAEDKAALLARCGELEARYPAIFIQFPGDEEMYGGCLASGRGFAYIGAGGELTPCPFSPVSDRNVKDLPLKSALASPLLKTVRDSRGLLKESEGGCALWSNREWLEGLVRR
jgi:MoaA/NifB/PqqE/SkfB family radical SAM enzyme